MSIRTILHGLLAATVVAAAAAGLESSPAGAAFPFKGACLDQTGCSICCPVCDHVCKLKAEKVDEEIPCFEVESKVICIPRVVFPWQKKHCLSCDSCDGQGCTDCVHNGARVRRICVLKSDKYKCPKCEYSWSAEPSCGGCDGGCDGCCESGCDGVAPGSWHAAKKTAQPTSVPTQTVSVQTVKIGQPTATKK